MNQRLTYETINITPAQAQTWLDTLQKAVEEGRARQRNTSEQVISRYADDMRNGKWGLTHQGIAFNSDGILLDGQHRLWAIIRSGVTVPMVIAFNLDEGPAEGIHPIDLIDCGKQRTVGNRLQLHGIANANYLAATMTAVARLYTGSYGRTLTLPQVLDVARLFQHGFEEMLVISGNGRGRWPTHLIGPLTVYHESHARKARAFAQSLINLTGLPPKSPIAALSKWLRDDKFARATGREMQYRSIQIVCNCLARYDAGEGIDAMRPSDEARVWLANMDKAARDTVRNLFRSTTTPQQPLPREMGGLAANT